MRRHAAPSLTQAVASLLCLTILLGAWPAEAAVHLGKTSGTPAPVTGVPRLTPQIIPAAAINPASAAGPVAAVGPAAVGQVAAVGIAAPASAAPASQPLSGLPAAAASAAAAPAAAAAETALESLSRAGAGIAERPEAAGQTLSKSFEAAKAGSAVEVDRGDAEPEPAAAPSKSGVKETVVGLAQLRRDVQKDARSILKDHMAGDVGDGVLHKDVTRVLKRLLAAAGVEPQAAQVFIGNSFLPNAFTTLPPSEGAYLRSNASIAKAFRVSNVFLSMGLLRAAKNEAELAIVIAHELMHNWKGHLKGFAGSHEMLGHFHEFEADAEALKLAARAGYDPRQSIEMLYSLHAEMARLEKEYALLGRDKNDLVETLNRLRDVHPHHDLRKASMLEHMNEAMELYAPRPEPQKTPKWMLRRQAADHPSHLDRYEARLANLTAAGPIEDALRALEGFLQKESAKRGSANTAETVIIEKIYRALAKRAESADDLRYIEVSARRLSTGSSFPSRRLKAALITRQLELSLRQDRPTLEQFQKLSPSLGEQVRRAGTLRVLGSVRDRRDLDGAFRALSREGENLGLDLEKIKAVPGHNDEADTLSFEVSQRLWKATRRVLQQELGRAPQPEEIIDELTAKLSPGWLKHYQHGLNIEILESAFGPQAYRSAQYSPSQLAGRLAGLPPGFVDKKLAEGSIAFAGFSEWSERHYRPHSATTANGRAIHTYERFYLDGLSSPSERDQLDILRAFWKLESRRGRDIEGPSETLLPKPMIRLLRQEGRIETFLKMAFDNAGEELKKKLKATAVAESRKAAVTWYNLQAELLLKSALQDAREIRLVREVLAAGWASTETLLEAPEINASFGPENRSRMADAFFTAAGGALRQSVIQYDRAGIRPDAAQLRETSALVRRIDASLRDFPTDDLLRAHAGSLAAHQGGLRTYMKAFHQALPHAVLRKQRKVFNVENFFDIDTGLPTVLHVPLMIVLAILWIVPGLILWAIASVQYWTRLGKYSLPGVPAKKSRPLASGDFVHFLALLGDPALPPSNRLMAAALLDRLDLGVDNGNDPLGQAIGMQASATLARWLVDDAVGQVQAPAQVAGLAGELLLLNERQPGFLQPDLREKGDFDHGFQRGARLVRRNEPYRSVIKGQHPFRGVNARWALDLLSKLDASAAWPAAAEDRFDLLDLINSSGEFSDAIDKRVLSEAKADADGFSRWMARDRARLKRWAKLSEANKESDVVKTPMGDIPLPVAQPLRIVRNPALRAQLFELLPESRLAESAQVSLRQRLVGYFKLAKAFRKALKFFSWGFLKSMLHEGSLEEKFIQVLEAADAYSARAAAEARERWDGGHFTKEDEEFFKYHLNDPKDSWRTELPHEKEEHVARYRLARRSAALSALHELYTAYAGVQEPALGVILENFPEPTRSRDELLERVMKSRKLTPAKLAFLESHKSYRMPNPVRVAEKHLLDATIIQMKKFTAAERVDILLHIVGIKRLSRDQERAYNRRVLSGDRRKLARDMASIRSIAQMESYLSLLHAKDKMMVVRAQFMGETSLHKSPREVERLYEKIVIEGRGLPPFLEKVFRTYFKILTDEEKSRLLADLAAVDSLGKDLKGPEIMRIALKGMGVTGAKVAQVLATHKGLLPPEYAAALEGFKDRAQDMDKMRAFQIAGARLAGLGAAHAADEAAVPSFDEIDAWAKEALPQTGEASRRAISAQVRYLLKDQSRWVRSIESLGRELGSGSIKVVYKVTLDDGRVWVVKLRAPGAAYSIKREFEILDGLVAALEAQGDLDLPGARQLLEEVQSLVRSEMNFVSEAEKEGAMRQRVAQRPWYARLFGAADPHVPKPHVVYAGEDLLVEEYVHSTRFSDLPRWRPLGPSQKRIAALAVREGMFALVFEGWLEPDPHTGNRHARRGWLYRFSTKMVLMDLGQGEAVPFDRLKPLMKAALALEAGDMKDAAAALVSIMKVPDNRNASEIEAAVAAGLAKTEDGVMERLMAGLIEAEKKSAIVKPEYASLQKAFILYAGYSPYLPKDYLYHSLERAAMARFYRERPVPLRALIKLYLRRLVRGRPAVRKEIEALIDRS